MRLLGVDFDNLGLEAALHRILARPPGLRFGYVVTPNADHIERLLRIPGLRPIYHRACLCLLDSRFLSHCARTLGLPTPAVVTGADLTAALLPHLAGQRVAIVGMAPGALAALQRAHPAIMFLHHNPPMGLLDNKPAFDAAVRFVLAAATPITFFAVGSPVQELLAYAVALAPDSTGTGLCIGAALEFAAGTTRRAPPWMQRAGLEWAHRLAHNPLHLAGRYLISDPRVLVALTADALVHKLRAPSRWGAEG